MEVHQDPIPDIERYIRNHDQGLEYYLPQYDGTVRNIEFFYQITRGQTRMLEIGCGTGWLPILARLDGIECDGLEISWQLRDYAEKQAKGAGLTTSGIRLGNIERDDLGDNVYDIIVANSVFEHVEYWRPALAKVYRALRPGGLFQFSSTNKFSFVSGEHWWPLYGWLPDQCRYKLRQILQGEEIMKLGIDFNQFRYPLLRREFKKLGYSQIYDRYEMKKPADFTGVKSATLAVLKSSSIVKHTALAFDPATVFTCIK